MTITEGLRPQFRKRTLSRRDFIRMATALGLSATATLLTGSSPLPPPESEQQAMGAMTAETAVITEIATESYWQEVPLLLDEHDIAVAALGQSVTAGGRGFNVLVGTLNNVDGARLIEMGMAGTHPQVLVENGFGNKNNIAFSAFERGNGRNTYVGITNEVDGASVAFSANHIDWHFIGEGGFREGASNRAVTAMLQNGQDGLFVGLRNQETGGQVWYYEFDSRETYKITDGQHLRKPHQHSISSFHIYQGELFVVIRGDDTSTLFKNQIGTQNWEEQVEGPGWISNIVIDHRAKNRYETQYVAFSDETEGTHVMRSNKNDGHLWSKVFERPDIGGGSCKLIPRGKSMILLLQTPYRGVEVWSSLEGHEGTWQNITNSQMVDKYVYPNAVSQILTGTYLTANSRVQGEAPRLWRLSSEEPRDKPAPATNSEPQARRETY